MEEIQKFFTVASVLNTKIIDYVIVSFQTLIALDNWSFALHFRIHFILSLVIGVFAISQVKAALKRGVEYGILRRYRGHYFLPTGDELDRANRIAGRFARLPTPAPTLTRSKISSSCKIKDSKRLRGISNTVRKSKKVRKTRTPAVSASPSLTDEIVGDAASVTE